MFCQTSGTSFQQAFLFGRDEGKGILEGDTVKLIMKVLHHGEAGIGDLSGRYDLSGTWDSGEISPIDGISDLRGIVSDFDQFRHIAEGLAWIAIEERHERFSGKYPLTICLNGYEFSAEYVGRNVTHAYVRGILSSIAFYEEWQRDFWDIPLSERKICLEKGREFYKDYVIPRELRFVERDWKYLYHEIEIFAGVDNISSSEWKRYLQRFEDAMVIEIGGYDAADYDYLAIKNDSMLLVSCGYWD